jgi:hypothetical protein
VTLPEAVVADDAERQRGRDREADGAHCPGERETSGSQKEGHHGNVVGLAAPLGSGRCGRSARSSFRVGEVVIEQTGGIQAEANANRRKHSRVGCAE